MVDETPTAPLGRLKAWWNRPKSKTREYLETFAVALALAFFVRGTIAEARYIPSESMLPSLEIGDRLIVEKISYRLHLPQRGDIVVFNPPERADPKGNAFIKRVIGLPGEHIDIHDGKVFINGKPLTEPYIMEQPMYRPPDWEDLGIPGGVIPPGKVFVMGDNRNNSQDSHVWGALPIENIIGDTVFRFWPVNRIGNVPHPAY
ncbi:MAG: lepB [Cyanobacteria bacterium RYN_339]|nr:lepB [Cyanobacteria bacterium RYN_339]